jgi:hypothetical protein
MRGRLPEKSVLGSPGASSLPTRHTPRRPLDRSLDCGGCRPGSCLVLAGPSAALLSRSFAAKTFHKLVQVLSSSLSPSAKPPKAMSNKRLHRQASILSTTSSTIPLAQDAGAEAPDGRARASTLLLRYSTDLGPAARAFVLPATDDAPARRERTLAEVERFLASLRQDELRSARASYVSAAAPRPRSKSRARATATATPRGLDANWCAKATPRSSVAPKSARTTMMTFTTEASSIDVPDFTPELFRVYKQARGSSESLVTGPVITAEDEVVYDGPGLFARRAPTPELTGTARRCIQGGHY